MNSRYSFTCKTSELGRVQYLVKKHDLRFTYEPLKLFSENYQVSVEDHNGGKGLNDFMDDMEMYEKEINHKPVKKPSIFKRILDFFKED